MGRPMSLNLKMTSYLVSQMIRRKERFPMTLMLEPLELCNLACEGCGRIREYDFLKHQFMSVEQCLSVANECGAPIVSIAGGEPTIHPQIDQIVKGIIKQGRFVYMCTNGLLMERTMKKIPPQKQFSFVVHVDGLRETHDRSVCREGVFDKAIAGIKLAVERGYRVCTNTTIYKFTAPDEIADLFEFLTGLGIEGHIVSPAYDYEAVGPTDIFMARQDAISVFHAIYEKTSSRNVRYYNNPLYLDFIRGLRDYQCAAWSNPTYTLQGWRRPCYMLAESHAQSFIELMEETDWDSYGYGRNPKCSNCMMHCGYEARTVVEAFKRPKDLWAMVKGGALMGVSS